jgi:triphosphoribosyl-dephospho-CoA synthase
MSIPGERVAQAYLDACRTELKSLKPGNVHAFAGGHRMGLAEFEASAVASAPALVEPGLAVGMRMHEAIRRTRDAVGCNTNLGIVLLCAPLAHAAISGSAGDLREGLATVLAGLDQADAEHAFAAIRLAAPAGLGESTRHDVHAPATGTLLAAMAEAQDRDLIARQYATAFADIFDLGVPRLEDGLALWQDIGWATSSAYLGFLGRFPDSHILRKFGPHRAEEVRQAALPLDADLLSCASPEAMVPALLAFDARLKEQAINPGTSADLTVASLFAFMLRRAWAANSHS